MSCLMNLWSRTQNPTFVLCSFLTSFDFSLLGSDCRLLIEYIETKNGPDGEEWRGYIFALSMCLVAMLQSIALHQYFHVVSVLGLNVRTAVIGMVYTKVGTRDCIEFYSNVNSCTLIG